MSAKQTRVRFAVVLPCTVEAIVVSEDGEWRIARVLDVDPEVNTPRSIEAAVEPDVWDDICAEANKQFDISDIKDIK